MRPYFRGLCIGMLSVVLLLGLSPGNTVAEEPQYGGTLRVSSQYPTIPPLSFDNYDWNWKHAHDTGLFLPHLLVGDLRKGPRGTNENKFHTDAWWPEEYRTGEVAESWTIEKDPLRIVFKLRKGIYWAEKPGIMQSRELVADDVVFSMQRIITSPKAIKGYIDYVDRWEALDTYTVALYLKKWNENWWYHYGMSYYAAIVPPEMAKAGAAKWQNLCSAGPYMLENYETGSVIVSTKNKNYWDKEVIDGKEYALPFTDSIRELLIKDTSSRISALRTGQIDMMLSIGWRDVESLKKTCPQLKWDKHLYTSPITLALRTDTKPFDDIRVRRALNLAVNQQEIVDKYYKGNADLIGYPYPSTWPEYFTPLEQLPPEARQLFTYDPEQAKKLLAEAGYPKGFTFTVQFHTASQTFAELAQLLKAYMAKIGVTMELEPLEYSAFLSKMTSKTHAPGYLMGSGPTNPQACIRKNFKTKETWNPYMFDDAYLNEELAALSTTVDMSSDERRERWKKLNVYAISQAPAVWLPNQYIYQAWWPWVKNYYGELYVGCLRYGPVWSRIWIDEKMKKEMGY